MCTLVCALYINPCCVFVVAQHELQSMDATLFHLLLADRGFLRAQHVRRRGGRELSQVPTAPGSRRSQTA